MFNGCPVSHLSWITTAEAAILTLSTSWYYMGLHMSASLFLMVHWPGSFTGPALTTAAVFMCFLSPCWHQKLSVNAGKKRVKTSQKVFMLGWGGEVANKSWRTWSLWLKLQLCAERWGDCNLPRIIQWNKHISSSSSSAAVLIGEEN